MVINKEMPVERTDAAVKVPELVLCNSSSDKRYNVSTELLWRIERSSLYTNGFIEKLRYILLYR
jgi:hypothetical protein